MGRYTTIQAFADNNANIGKVEYDKAALESSQATSSASGSVGTVKADKVNNVMGSTAGAGSGDFHHYRHCRRKEFDRIAGMESKLKDDAELREFEERVESKRKECEERTRKNAEKRRKKKAKKNQGRVGSAEEESKVIKEAEDSPVSDSEFSYVPVHLQQISEEVTIATEKKIDESDVIKAIVANDGSFLEKTKDLLKN